jgi:hypothetical protein
MDVTTREAAAAGWTSVCPSSHFPGWMFQKITSGFPVCVR